MGTTKDGLSFWQAENEGFVLLDTTIGDLLDRCIKELGLEDVAKMKTA